MTKVEFETMARTLHSELPFSNHDMTGRYIKLCLENFSIPFQAMRDALSLLKEENEKRQVDTFYTENRREFLYEVEMNTISFEIVKKFVEKLDKRLS